MAGKGGSLHESFASSKTVSRSSNRSFGLVFAGFFAILAALSWWDGGHRWPWHLTAATAFATTALLAPAILDPLNRLWTAFGLLLHKIVNPFVMGVIFFGVISPLALLMRSLKKRPLELGFDRSAPSYWIKRPGVEQTPDAMKRQF